MSKHPVENLLRDATELYTSITAISCAAIIELNPKYFLLTDFMAPIACASLALFGFYRGFDAYKVLSYQSKLKKMPFFALSTKQVPLSNKWLFVGAGFRWLPIHTQRLSQIKQINNQDFLEKGKAYKWARKYAEKHTSSPLTKIFNSKSSLNPFKPLPDVGGAPYLHGLGNEDKPVFIPQSIRGGHTFVLGTTGVGKTRTASILINQDIRLGGSVIVVDPKGDLELVRDMYSAANASGRLKDFKIVHLGFPELSATYNPLQSFDQISEVATRVTSAIPAEGEGAQFQKFAWQYVDVVAKALREVGQKITYKNIAFFITRLDQLLMCYADHVMPNRDDKYLSSVQSILNDYNARVDKNGNQLPPIPRYKAVHKYIQEFVNDFIASGKSKELQGDLLVEILEGADLDDQYYRKITASVGPVLSEINGSNACNIFSSEDSDDIKLMDVIKNNKILYIGLDSLTNANVAQAVGKAFLSDLVSTAGKIYKAPSAKYNVNIHCDEISEFIQDSFVKVLNKARGAGFQVTAYGQTIQDLEVSLGSRAKAEMTQGNLNTLVLMRVVNKETASILTDMLPKVDIINHTQVSLVNDSPHGDDGEYFNTTNEDRVQMTSVPMLDPSDVLKLPKGQAFILVNGGELYKVRIPLPLNDGLCPNDINKAMQEINGCNDYPLKMESESNNPLIEIKNESSESKNNEISVSMADSLVDKKTCTDDVVIAIDTEKNKKTEIEKEKLEKIYINEIQVSKKLDDFISWLESRISSNNRQFSLDSAKLVLCNIEEYGNDTVFIKEETLFKYQSRSGVSADELSKEIINSYPSESSFYVDDDGEKKILLPLKLTSSISTEKKSNILKGEL